MATSGAAIVDAIAVDKVRKAFGATVALDGASFSAAAGEVHALLGENGAGKSTLVKALSGLLRPDGGRIELFGVAARFAGPRDAHAAGLQTAFQELTLVPNLTVWENLLLPYQPVGVTGLLRGRRGEAFAAEQLRRFGLGDISPRQEVSGLDLALRQKIEIVRAVAREPRVLLLDEPTSALTGRDIDWLGEIIATEKRRGATIVFISHRMPEVRMFCDRLTVLRNGRDVGDFAVGDVSDERVIELIIGRSLASTFPAKPVADRGQPPVLEAQGLRVGRLAEASFALRPGEILGVAGLQGMGQLELFLTLFGDLRPNAGRILVDGQPVTFESPRAAIAAGIGIGLVPEERKTEALFLKLDGRRNASLPSIDRFVRPGLIGGGLIDGEAETAAVAGALARVQVDPRALWSRAGAFSGGNQQKIVLAKWLLTGSRVLLLFDPTRGVDVGTKHEIYLLIADFVRAGGAVLLYSTELAEVANLCRRVLVVYGGRVVRELDDARDEISEAAIMRAALGTIEGDASAVDAPPAEASPPESRRAAEAGA
ncbi:MAG TPA: sugar ABC transporter ATP-binding protein [Stellaceae bacterium]|nr:sugar ABC transporter ATP-binding protein [Stellaceae bacterium]